MFAIPWGSRSGCTVSGPWEVVVGTCCWALWPCCPRSPRVCSRHRASGARCRSSANTAGTRWCSTGAGTVDRCTFASKLPAGRYGNTSTVTRSSCPRRVYKAPAILVRLTTTKHYFRPLSTFRTGTRRNIYPYAKTVQIYYTIRSLKFSLLKRISLRKYRFFFFFLGAIKFIGNYNMYII